MIPPINQQNNFKNQFLFVSNIIPHIYHIKNTFLCIKKVDLTSTLVTKKYYL